MKQFVLPLAAVLLGSAAASAQNANVYASALKCADGKIQFVLNTPADKVVLNLIKDNQIVESIDLGAGVKGLNTVAIPATSAAPAGSYNWSLTASAPAVTKVTQLTDGTDLDLQVNRGKGIDVDVYPGSPNFGNVYVVSAGGDASRTGNRIGGGLYVFNSALQALNADPYTGGFSWEVGSSNPYAVSVSENGQVFIASWADSDQSGVYYAEPNDLGGAWKDMFAPGQTDENGLMTIDGTKIHGSIGEVLVVGSGADRKLYTSDEDYGEGTNRLEYAIGNLESPWATGPTRNLGHPDGYINGTQNWETDKRGGMWLSQYRWQESNANACIYHVNANNECDFHTGDKSIFVGSTSAAAMAVTLDGKRMAVLGGDSGSDMVIADITFGEDGVPTLAKAYGDKFGAPYTNRAQDCAFDPADNLYIIFNQNGVAGGVALYALPKDKNEYTTPAFDQITVQAGVEDISVSDNDEVQAVYNLNGVKVDADNLGKGLYIVRTAKGAYKKVVK